MQRLAARLDGVPSGVARQRPQALDPLPGVVGIGEELLGAFQALLEEGVELVSHQESPRGRGAAASRRRGSGVDRDALDQGAVGAGNAPPGAPLPPIVTRMVWPVTPSSAATWTSPS